MGFIVGIFTGALAGWIAEKVMKNDMSLLMNIVYGVVGGFVGNLLLGLVHIDLGSYGFIGNVAVAVLGACVIIAVGRALKKKK